MTAAAYVKACHTPSLNPPCIIVNVKKVNVKKLPADMQQRAWIRFGKRIKLFRLSRIFRPCVCKRC